MAQGRGGRRGIANLVTSGVLLLFGALGFAAGCSAGETNAEEQIASDSQAATLCTCPDDNPCATFTCNTLTGACTAKVLIAEGGRCTDKLTLMSGVCHLNLCCSGCVVAIKGRAPVCSPREGTADTQCGQSGTTCKDCTGYADACHASACVSKSCEVKDVADGDSCLNTTGACYKGACCQGCIDGNDQCVAGGDVSACGVSSGKLVKCQNCDDGNDCNGKDTCAAGSCQTGAPPDCNDNEVCTEDSCSSNGCEHKPRTGADCSDGDPCTTGDKCGSDGKCAPGAQIKCDDGEFCTADSCKDGVCVNQPKPTSTTCDDSNKCTSGDKCTSAGKCVGTSNTTFTCEDGNVCTINVQPDCSVEQCTTTFAAATQVCPSVDKCHQAGHCSGNSAECLAGPAINCDDQNPCTKDSCDPDTGCVNENDASADCSDGDPCTENDVCVKGTCGGKPKKCEPLDSCHEPGTCDQTTGTCNDPRSEDGKACPGGTCEKGTCVLDPNAIPGAGGEAAGGAAPGAGGEGPAAGGAGSGPVGEAGQGATTPAEGGKGGTTTEEEPERPFVRNPGGCSCDLPGHAGSRRGASLAVLAVLAGVLLRRSRRQDRAA